MPGPVVDPFHGDDDLPAAVDVVVSAAASSAPHGARARRARGERRALREGRHRAGAVEPQLGLGAHLAPRSTRGAAHGQVAAAVARNGRPRSGRPTGYCARASSSPARTRRRSPRPRAGPGPSAMADRPPDASPRSSPTVVPGARLAVRGALHTLDDGRAEPQKATRPSPRGRASCGAHVLTDARCAASRRKPARSAASSRSAGRSPARRSCSPAARGRASSPGVRIDLPQLKVRNTVMRTAPLAGGPEPRSRPDFAVRKRAGRRLHRRLVGPQRRRHRPRLLPPRPRLPARAPRRVADAALPGRRRLPRRGADAAELGDGRGLAFRVRPRPRPRARARRERARTRGGARHSRPSSGRGSRSAGRDDRRDPRRRAGDLAGRAHPGFFIATGFSGHGFGIGPAAGRLMADLVTGATPLVDPAAFRLGRFSDGTWMEILGGYWVRRRRQAARVRRRTPIQLPQQIFSTSASP